VKVDVEKIGGEWGEERREQQFSKNNGINSGARGFGEKEQESRFRVCHPPSKKKGLRKPFGKSRVKGGFGHGCGKGNKKGAQRWSVLPGTVKHGGAMGGEGTRNGSPLCWAFTSSGTGGGVRCGDFAGKSA